MATTYADESVIERLERLSMPEPNSGCVLWIGSLDRKGYGRVSQEQGVRYAHRAAYEVAVGPIPPGLQIDHLCCVRCCINPRHLEAVTGRENNLRSNSPTARRARQTECKYGHPFDGANTLLSGTHRSCRTCYAARLERMRERRATGYPHGYAVGSGRLGIPIQEYAAHKSAGEDWCYGHRRWEAAGQILRSKNGKPLGRCAEMHREEVRRYRQRAGAS